MGRVCDPGKNQVQNKGCKKQGAKNNDPVFCTLLFATHILDLIFFKVPDPKKISDWHDKLDKCVQIDWATMPHGMCYSHLGNGVVCNGAISITQRGLIRGCYKVKSIVQWGKILVMANGFVDHLGLCHCQTYQKNLSTTSSQKKSFWFFNLKNF